MAIRNLKCNFNLPTNKQFKYFNKRWTNSRTFTQSNSEIINNTNLELDIVTEGKARIRLNNDDRTFSSFYNPAQVKYLKNLGIQ